MKRWMMLLFFVVCVTIVSACGSGKDAGQTQDVLDDPQWQEAAVIYKKQCISCHAADLSGNVGPSLQNVGSRLSKEQIAEIVRNGGGGMPAFKDTLTKEEIETLSDWLTSKK